MNTSEKPLKEIPSSLRFGKDIKVKEALRQHATEIDRSFNWLIISICKEYLKSKNNNCRK